MCLSVNESGKCAEDPHVYISLLFSTSLSLTLSIFYQLLLGGNHFFFIVIRTYKAHCTCSIYLFYLSVFGIVCPTMSLFVWIFSGYLCLSMVCHCLRCFCHCLDEAWSFKGQCLDPSRSMLEENAILTSFRTCFICKNNLIEIHRTPNNSMGI